MRYLLLLFLPLTAWGQFGVEQPFFSAPASSSPYQPTNEPYAQRWWVASDLATNTVVTNWVDRIAGEPITNTAALGPTNSSLGIGFDGSHYLKLSTNHEFYGGNPSWSNSLFLVVRADTPPNNFSILLSINSGGGMYTAGTGLFTRQSNGYWYWQGNSANAITPVDNTRWLDMIITSYSAAPAHTKIYTNGVLCVDLSDRSEVSWDTIGYTYLAGTYWIGQLREVLWASNIWNTVTVSNLHWYATNTYKFSP